MSMENYQTLDTTHHSYHQNFTNKNSHAEEQQQVSRIDLNSQ